MTSKKIQVLEILMKFFIILMQFMPISNQGHLLIFVEVNVCFALSKASVTVKAVQRLHRLSSKSFNIYNLLNNSIKQFIHFSFYGLGLQIIN
jgi:hypothetical protein